MTDQMFYTSGAGNSFLLSFDMNTSFEALKGYALAGRYKPDGFIMFEDINDSYFEWKFLNNDGGEVDFCGNALRAVGICAQQAYGFDTININTLAGICEVQVLEDGRVKAEMPKPTKRGDIDVDGFGSTPLIDAGVPHLVFKADDLDQKKLLEKAKKIRSMNLSDDAQTYNLSFYLKDSSPIDAVTFERGVEDFTLACGSGAMAVSYVVSKETDVSVKMPGGLLDVQYEDGKAFMIGAAQVDKTLK